MLAPSPIYVGMARKVAITSYGNQDDRDRVAALARLNKTSVSDYIISVIRSGYREVYGDTPPEKLKNGRP